MFVLPIKSIAISLSVITALAVFSFFGMHALSDFSVFLISRNIFDANEVTYAHYPMIFILLGLFLFLLLFEKWEDFNKASLRFFWQVFALILIFAAVPIGLLTNVVV